MKRIYIYIKREREREGGGGGIRNWVRQKDFGRYSSISHEIKDII
jgi:hypothetical protein